MLGGAAQLVVPRPVVRELELLGKEFAAAAKLAKRLKLLPASATGGSAVEAILQLVRSNGEHKLCVLTEDPALQRELSRIPGVPLLRFAREKLILSAPTERLAASQQTAMDKVGSCRTLSPMLAGQDRHVLQVRLVK